MKKVILCVLFLAAFAVVAESAEKQTETVDYFQLKIGNRWVFLQPTGKTLTFEAVEKIDNSGVRLYVTQEGQEDKAGASWFVENGYFTMKLGGSSLKLVKLPVNPGDEWMLAQNTLCKLENAGEVKTEIGSFKNCISSKMTTRTGEKVKTIVYTFAPGVGLIRIERYIDNKLDMTTPIIEARIDGVLIGKKEETGKKEPKTEDTGEKKKAARKAFIEAMILLAEKKLDLFYECFSDKYRETVSLDEFKKQFESGLDERIEIVKKLKVTEVKLDPDNPDRATVVSELEDVEDSAGEVVLIRENGKWKLTGL